MCEGEKEKLENCFYDCRIGADRGLCTPRTLADYWRYDRTQFRMRDGSIVHLAKVNQIVHDLPSPVLAPHDIVRDTDTAAEATKKTRVPISIKWLTQDVGRQLLTGQCLLPTTIL
jgi:hypothetical protein